MGVKVSNNAYGTLAANITAAATTITLTAGQGARFPALGANEWAWATLSNAADTKEIVKITARAGDTLTVVRGQDGTTANAYLTGDRLDMRPCAAAMNDKVDTDALTTALAAKLDTTTAAATYRTEAQVNAALTSYAPLNAPTFTNQVKFAGGSASAPGITFTGDTDTGLYRTSDGTVSVTSNGSTVLNMGTSISALTPVYLQSGTASAPSLAFVLDTNTGFIRTAEGTIGVVCNGVVVATFSPSGVTVNKITQTSP
jgi:hypothetical protein